MFVKNRSTFEFTIKRVVLLRDFQFSYFIILVPSIFDL